MPTKSATDLILLSRQKANVERSKFVSDAEVLVYINDGRKELRDLVIAADPSYYHQQFDLVFNSPAGYPAGSAALPTNIYKLRGVTQNPDTDQRRTIHPLAFADRDGRGYRKSGYTLDGDYLTVVPAVMVNEGPVRLYLTPKLLPLAPVQPLDVESILINIPADGSVTGFGVGDFNAVNSPFLASDIGNPVSITGAVNSDNNGSFGVSTYISAGSVVLAGSHTSEAFPTSAHVNMVRASHVTADGTWTLYGDTEFANGFTQADVGGLLGVTGTANGNDGIRVILSVLDPATVTTAPTGLTAENFGGGIVATFQAPGTVNNLDVTLDNFDSYISTYAAIRIATKAQKTPLADNLQAQLAQDEARVSQMAAVRAGEPEAIPVLWHPASNPMNPWGGGWG
jgi:hypothetical protein